MAKVKGYVVYQGPSQLDGAPIVCIATMETSNKKTGNLIGTWILRSDIEPIEASHTGADSSICGDCIHRGEAQGTKVKIAHAT